MNIFTEKFVSLVVDDTFVMKKNRYKWSERLNQLLGAQKVNLLISGLEIDEHKMAAFINEVVSTQNSNRQDVLKKYFDH